MTEEEAAAELAWERSDGYEWCGQRLTWSKRHRWFVLTVARYAMQASELDALLAMWVAQMDTKALKEAQASWRRDPDALLEAFYEWSDAYDENSAETGEAIEVFAQMWEDVEASTNKPSEGGNGGDPDEWDGMPKKHQPQPATSTNSEPQPA